jgi:hypothetical protein
VEFQQASGEGAPDCDHELPVVLCFAILAQGLEHGSKMTGEGIMTGDEREILNMDSAKSAPGVS